MISPLNLYEKKLLWAHDFTTNLLLHNCIETEFISTVTPTPATANVFVFCEYSFQAHNWLSRLLSVFLQVAVEDRLKLLQEAHRDFGPSSQHFLSSEYRTTYLSWEIRSFWGTLSLFPLSYTGSQTLNFCISHLVIFSHSSGVMCFTVLHAQWICACMRIRLQMRHFTLE